MSSPAPLPVPVAKQPPRVPPPPGVGRVGVLQLRRRLWGWAAASAPSLPGGAGDSSGIGAAEGGHGGFVLGDKGRGGEDRDEGGGKGK